jgi:hypothetical protein
MIIIPDNKLVLLLPWKTGSQTLRTRLHPFNRSLYPEFFHFNPHLNRVVHQHLILADFAVLPESREQPALAVFVRNPYDRVYSGFQQLIRDVAQQPHWAFPTLWIKDLVVEQLTCHHAALSQARFDINTWFDALPVHAVMEAGRDTSLPLHPAHYWTHMNGRGAAQFVGRVEQFERDFAALCQRFGIEGAGAQSANRSGGSDGAIDARGYRYADRLSPRTIAKINALFAADFDLFGYEKIVPATI